MFDSPTATRRPRPLTALSREAWLLLLPLLGLGAWSPEARGQALARQGKQTAVPSAAADFAPAHVPTAAELEAAGWAAASDTRARAQESVPVAQPRIPVQIGVARLSAQPEALPRPSLEPAEAPPIPIPLAARTDLLERVESEDGPLMAWKPRIRAEALAEGLGWVVDVDAPPRRAPAPPDQADLQSAFRRAERGLAEAPVRASAALRVSPERRFRLEPPPEAEVAPSLGSELQVRPLEGDLAEDALLVVLARDRSWWRVELGASAGEAGTHRLGLEDVLAADGRLFVSPVAVADDAALELFAFEGPSLDRRLMAFPRPAEARWRCDVQDLRFRDGRLEALVAVHDPKLRRGPEVQAADSWAALLVLDGASWTERERIALPGDARALRLRFDAAPLRIRLEHDGRVLGTRNLARP